MHEKNSNETQKLRKATPALAPLRGTRRGLALALGIGPKTGTSARNASGEGSSSADQAINDVQALLLQVSFAIMMIFMIAYFMFRTKTTREAEEQILELQRQKLIAAIEQTVHEAEAHYGLTVLTSLTPEGEVLYQPEACVENGRITSIPQFRNAFCQGAVHAHRDFADQLALRRTWISNVLERAEIREDTLRAENTAWLGSQVDSRVGTLRAQVRNVQLLCASLLQEYWTEHPEQISDPAVAELLQAFQAADEEKRLLLAGDIAAALRAHCLNYLARETSVPMLP